MTNSNQSNNSELRLAYLSLAMERLGEMVIVTDLEQRITYANPAAGKILGYSPIELIGRRAGDIFDNIPGNPSDLSRWITEQQEDEVWRGEILNRRKDGSIINILLSLSHLRDQTGKIIGAVGVSMDITDRKKIGEKTLEKEKLRRKKTDDELLLFKTISDQANYGTVIASLEGNLIYINKHFAGLHQHTPEELIGKNLSILHTEEQMERVNSLNNYLKTNRSYYAEEVWHKKKDGTVFPTMMNGTVIDNEEGEPLFISATAVAITEKLRAEEEKEQMKEQLRQAQNMESAARMAGGMAHDFGNLLNAIRGYVEIVKNQLHAEDPLRSEIKELDNTVIRAGSLIRKLLSFGRRQAIQPVNINLNTIISELAGMLRRLCGPSIEIDFILYPGLPLIYADRDQMEQIIINMAVNAKDAVGNQGKITIKTDFAGLGDSLVPRIIGKQPGDYVVLVVEDNGRGMDASARAKIFEPFFTTKDTDNSSGLGLSIVYGIVEQSRGFIQMDSSPGEGTTFNIYFPAIKAEKDLTSTQLTGRNKKILLMEDDAEIRAVTGELLKSVGGSVTHAADGRTAIAFFTEAIESGHPFDAVLLDLIISGGSGGEEVIKSLRTIDPGIKAVLCSGYITDPIVTSYREYGFDAILTKPFTRGELKEVLDKLIGEHS